MNECGGIHKLTSHGVDTRCDKNETCFMQLLPTNCHILQCNTIQGEGSDHTNHTENEPIDASIFLFTVTPRHLGLLYAMFVLTT